MRITIHCVILPKRFTPSRKTKPRPRVLKAKSLPRLVSVLKNDGGIYEELFGIDSIDTSLSGLRLQTARSFFGFERLGDSDPGHTSGNNELQHSFFD